MLPRGDVASAALISTTTNIQAMATMCMSLGSVEFHIAEMYGRSPSVAGRLFDTIPHDVARRGSF
jgi:hypothetical protein